MKNISPTQLRILEALANGSFLKSHRFVDGKKVYQLRSADNTPLERVRWTTVDALHRRGLIYSNFKFPAAMYHLTEQGKLLVSALNSAPNQ